MKKRVGKRGDTLVEVMLAVGIFSMVAIAIVAVMSGGVSSAQTALETTLTREEIDAQAEALRFIHSAYIADKNAGTESEYSKLWKKITSEHAVDIEGKSEGEVASITQYSPTTCQELYSGSNSIFGNQKPFVLNTKKLNNDVGNAIISGNSKLLPAATYPHLVYGNNTNNSDTANLAENTASNNLYAAEGIYIVAVKDPSSTLIMGSDNERESAYFDFYIRTCWYGTGDQVASNISTVMRLYDPDAVKEIAPANQYTIKYHPNSHQIYNKDITLARIGGNAYFKSNEGYALLDIAYYIESGKKYVGPALVSLNSNAASYRIDTGDNLSTNSDGSYNYSNLDSWKEMSNLNIYNRLDTNADNGIVSYYLDGSTLNNKLSAKNGEAVVNKLLGEAKAEKLEGGEYEQDFYSNERNRDKVLASVAPIRLGYKFIGWSCSPAPGSDDDIYKPSSEDDSTIKANMGKLMTCADAKRAVDLYAIWKEDPNQLSDNIYITLNWTPDSTDYDSYLNIKVDGVNKNLNYFTYDRLRYYEIDDEEDYPAYLEEDGKTIATLDVDCTSDCSSKREQISLNIMPNTTNYYYVHNYTKSGSNTPPTGATVTISSDFGEYKAYRSDDILGNSGDYWNVFKITSYNNGIITITTPGSSENGTFTDDPNTTY